MSPAPRKSKHTITQRPTASDAAAVRCLVPAGIAPAVMKRWLHQARQRLPKRYGAVSIVIVGPANMRQLNQSWRGKPKPTNVLSFQLASGRSSRSPNDLTWGEIILCPDVIRREAKSFNRTYREHFRRLLEHGVIHLFGLDHQTVRQQQTWARYERRLNL